jgi:hypothetical protein
MNTSLSASQLTLQILQDGIAELVVGFSMDGYSLATN